MRRIVLLPLLLAACASPSGETITPTELRLREQQQREAEMAAQARGVAGGPPALAHAPGAADSGPGVAGGMAPRSALNDEQTKKRDELDRRRTELQRRNEDHGRDAFELEQRRKRVELDQRAAAAQEAVTLEAAERDHRLAAEDLERFRSQEKPRRLAEDTLDLELVKDGLLDSLEELKQLEMMYSGSELGDATAEIVLNRTRRRLERAQERHRLRVERSDELKKVTLPRDEESRVQAERAKAVSLENVRLAQQKARLEREAGLRDLDFEARKLARQADDVLRDQAALDRDLSTWTRELSGAPAAGP